MFACCCGVGALPALLGKPYDEIRDCWRHVEYGLRNVTGRYTVPKTGYWALSISSYGVDVNNAQNIVEGTAYYVGKFTKGEIIEYELGSDFGIGDGIRKSIASFRDVRLNTKVEGSGKQYPAFLMRWIGDDFSLQAAKVIDVEELRVRDRGRFPHCNIFEDGTDVFALNGNKVFVPSVGDWARMPPNKAHWYMQNVNLAQTGTYEVYVLGDDEQRLALNGVPVVWSNPISSPISSLQDCRREQHQGTFEITAAGLYQLMVMQVNVPAATPSWTAVVIKQPDGTLLDLINNWQYIETTHDCENKFIVPVDD